MYHGGMTDEKFDKCPIHGNGEHGHSWPCPVAVEGDPEDAKTCEYFLDEMDRRAADIEAGNYFAAKFEGDKFYTREFRNHEPVGDWEFRLLLTEDDEDNGPDSLVDSTTDF